jgi:hypothetical protein
MSEFLGFPMGVLIFPWFRRRAEALLQIVTGSRDVSGIEVYITLGFLEPFGGIMRLFVFLIITTNRFKYINGLTFKT